MTISIIQVQSQPGIKRDGTVLDGEGYTDGRWCRFQRARPRKIGGYRSINKYLSDVVRTLVEQTRGALTYVHCGSASKIERFYIDNSNNTSVITDRTPTSGLTADDANLWQFAATTRLVAGVPQPVILAQVAPNLENITNAVGGEIFYGDLFGTAPLAEITLIPTGFNASGGVAVLHPYTFFFGNSGYVAWSIPGDPADLTGAGSGSLNIAAQKIVRGMPMRGGPANSPSGLFWSADALVRASFVGGTPIFQFDTISTETSILSAASAIEYDGIFYWCGVDRFLMFNGVVREIPNNMNINWFFDNLNYEARQKVFAMKVPRYGEIWWCFPFGDATEPTHALILNVRDNVWYDTELPLSGRSAGLFPTVFRKPLMTGAEGSTTAVSYRVTEVDDDRITESGDFRVTEDSEITRYKLWVHEQGTDEIDGQDIQPIESYFETGDISLPAQPQNAINRATHIALVEPDFIQSGDMTVQIFGRANARAPDVEGPILTFSATASTPQETVIYFKEQRRQLRFRFGSNVIGGDYQMGLVLAHARPGDGTTVG